MVVVLLAFVKLAVAQYDPNAKKVLDNMSRKYKAIPAFRANVSYSLVNETENLNEEYTGKVIVKGDKYFLALAGQEVINDGETLWTYLEEINEVNITNYDPDDEEFTPSKIYNIYESGYKYTLLAEVVMGGQPVNVVELVPEDQNSQFFKVTLYIGKADSSLKSWRTFDRNGNVYVYTISDFKEDATIQDSFFKFDAAAHEGVEEVDFR